MKKRLMKITEIDYNAKIMKGTFNIPVRVNPTESFDHCDFLEIKRFD